MSTISARVFTRKDFILAALIFVVAVSCAWVRRADGVCGVTHDDGVYVILGKALAGGEGLRLINLPGSPVQSKYPIVYPAALSAIWLAVPQFPANVILFQALSAFCTGAWLSLSALFMVRYIAPRTAAYGAALISATSPYVAYVGSLTMSDPPFCVVFVLALWWLKWRLDKQVDEPVDRHRQWTDFLGGLLICIPYLTRALGLPVLLAGWAILLFKRRANRWMFLGSAIALAPWFAWMGFCKLHQVKSFVMMYYNDYGGWWASHSQTALWKIVCCNLWYGTFSLSKLPLQGFWFHLGSEDGASLAQVACLLVGAAMWLCTFLMLRKEVLLVSVIALYAAILLVWPWPPARVLLPLFPLSIAMLLGALNGRLERAIGGKRWTVISIIVLVCIAAMNVSLLWKHHQITAMTGFTYTDRPKEFVQWRSYVQAADWVRANLKDEDRVAANADSLTYLYSGVRCYRPFVTDPTPLFYGGKESAVGTSEQLAALLDGYGSHYLVYMPLTNYPEEAAWVNLLADFTQKYASRLRQVYKGSDARFAVYQWSAQQH